MERIIDSSASESEIGHPLEDAEVIVCVEFNHLSPGGNIFSEEPMGLAGRDLWAEREGGQRRVALGQCMCAHE